jgi:hypothetical protein
MAYAVIGGPIGNQQITPFNLPDTTARQTPGMIVNAVDPYWGGGEFIYVKAGGTIRTQGLCTILQTFASGQVVYTATEVPNTANLGRMLGVAQTSATVGQYLWLQISGVTPVNCQAAVAADTAFGIAAAGQGGANSAGKQILNARVVVASTQTVAKTGCTANSGSTRLLIPSADGWFIGAYLSGTGIAALTVVTDIDPSGTICTLSVATTAPVAGTVTAT